jgi:crotonobetainyl-CoA:carnitine CoA-transferase CaiB-like acyl-CoA transferase
MALFDVMVGVLANQALNYFVSGKTPRRIGSAHPNIVPYQTLPVRDGHVMLAVGSDAQFAKLCAVLGRTDLVSLPAYQDNKGRVAKRAALIDALRTELAFWDRDVLLAKLEAVGVPAGRSIRWRTCFVIRKWSREACDSNWPPRMSVAGFCHACVRPYASPAVRCNSSDMHPDSENILPRSGGS